MFNGWLFNGGGQGQRLPADAETTDVGEGVRLVPETVTCDV
jgi:hypothetical protein